LLLETSPLLSLEELTSLSEEESLFYLAFRAMGLATSLEEDEEDEEMPEEEEEDED
jgi:hypothetical protein